MLDKVKEFIKDNIEDADCGIFFTRNILGDSMTTVYNEDGVTIDICYGNRYFEIFGLSEDDEREIEDYYDNLCKEL